MIFSGIKNILWLCMPFAASAVMLTVIQLPIGLSHWAWIAYVPFVLACSPNANLRYLAISSYLVGLCYWLANLYWVEPVTLLGWLAFCLYTAVLWPLIVYALRWCRTRKLPLFIALPLLVVGVENIQGFFLGGFYWRFLAHSQYANIPLIQIADIFGASGVSFLIAMVNGLLAEFILASRDKSLFKISSLIKTIIVGVSVIVAILYGQWRIKQSENCIKDGPLVCSVQSNVPQSVKDSGSAQNDEMMFNDLMRDSNAAAKSGAELIVWPETMVQAILDQRVLMYLNDTQLYRVFDKRLKDFTKDNKTYLLVGATAQSPN